MTVDRTPRPGEFWTFGTSTYEVVAVFRNNTAYIHRLKDDGLDDGTLTVANLSSFLATCTPPATTSLDAVKALLASIGMYLEPWQERLVKEVIDGGERANYDATLEAIIARQKERDQAAIALFDAPAAGQFPPYNDEISHLQIPFAVEQGWNRSVYIPHTGGPTYRVLFYPDGSARFEHRCDRGERGVIICAPLLDPGHTITCADPLTITPSILCSDCNTHGFITNGRWHS